MQMDLTILSVCIAFDVAGIVVLALFMFPMMRIGDRSERKARLFAAGLLHLVAEFIKIAGGLPPVLRGTGGMPYYSRIAMMLDVVSFLFVLGCILTDRDGRVRLSARTDAIRVSLLVAALLPPVAAVFLEVVAHTPDTLGLAYAVSLHLIHLQLKAKQDRSIMAREIALDQTQAKLLINQMQPHFIFNSLMTIEGLCHADPEKAAESVEHFAGYLRGNIDALSASDLIPFARELDHIREYEALEHADPERRFAVQYELETTDFFVPALSIQPVVENAIRYGALSRRDGTGRVVLRTERHGIYIRIIVEDNGIDAESAQQGMWGHRGVGLANAERLIIGRCGGNFHFAQTGSGVRVTILIPRDAAAAKDTAGR